MRNAIEIEGEFLKCDASGCDHVETVEVINEALIGKPCPQCGANLLTREDLNEYRKLVAICDFANASFPQVAEPSSEAGLVRVSVNTRADEWTITVAPSSPPAPTGGD